MEMKAWMVGTVKGRRESAVDREQIGERVCIMKGKVEKMKSTLLMAVSMFRSVI